MTAIATGCKKAGLSGLFLISAVLAATLAPSKTEAQPVALEVAAANAAYDRRTSEPVVTFRLTEASRKRFASFTQENVGRAMTMIVDGRVLVKAVIREPITGGAGQIANKLTADEAKTLAERLASGKARLEVEVAN